MYVLSLKMSLFQIIREKEAALESLADRELTIVKFRELVQKLQDQCQDLQHQLAKETSNQAAIKTAIPEMLDYKVSSLKLMVVFSPSRGVRNNRLRL